MTVGIDIGIGALSAFLQVFFDRLASKPVLDFFRKLDLEKELERLNITFRNVTTFLARAEDKQYNDDAVKIWLDRIRDAIYDAEDLIDELETDLGTERQKCSNKVLDSVIDRFKQSFKSRIEDFSNRFDQLAKDIFVLGLEKLAAGSLRPSETDRATTCLVNEARIYGRGNDKEEMVKLLLEDDLNHDNVFSVIAIVGMGGVGKTTLAQIVYNDELVDGHFDLKVWIYVSDQFDLKRVTKTILESVIQGNCDSVELNGLDAFNFRRITKASLELVTLETPDFIDLNQIQLKLKKELNGKKFLIVLDDVWNTKYGDWDLLQKPLGVGAVGSKIVVTTRDDEVALMMGAISVHHLDYLSEADCWSLFKEHAFGSTENDPEQAVIREKVAKKCKGLPLAAKILGGLLRSKRKHEWEAVLNNKIWDLTEQNEVLPVLKLSYYYLPSHLKRCFTYCSIFPKDYEFGEKELVLLWMAEGFLQQPKGNMDLEDFGHMCFYELLSRLLFQPSCSKETLFVMHPLMSDLAQWVAGQTCFRLEDWLDSNKQVEISRKARHSSYIIDRYNGSKIFEAFHGVGSLRTFLPLKKGARAQGYIRHDVTDLLPRLKCLRVLSFSGSYITELPNSVFRLKHLRFLNLSHTAIKSLSQQVSNLYNLQTLLLAECKSLEKLPIELGTLINLRHLDITNSKLKAMPIGVGKLTSLRKLSDFVVGRGNSEAGIGELVNLNHLKGALCISQLDNVTKPEEAWRANLSGKKYLDALTVRWGDNIDDRQNHELEEKVLDMLRPHATLKELTIIKYGGKKYPTWVGDHSFSNMVFIKLENCERCTDLPPLGQLQSLKVLHIKGMNGIDSVGKLYEDDCSSPFLSLESLCFENMRKWESWLTSEINDFPRLGNLTIENCPKLFGNLPKHLPSLEKLVIRRCDKLIVKLSSLPRLCELETDKCQEVVFETEVDLNSLKSIILRKISTVTCLKEESIQELKGLQELEVSGGVEIVSLLETRGDVLENFTLLGRLQLEGCENLNNLRSLHYLTSLSELSICKCQQLVSFTKAGLPSNLKKLQIKGCNSLKSIGREILFSTVKELEIGNCPGLLYLLHEDEVSSSDSDNRPISVLEHLRISRCSKLKSIGNWLHDDMSLSSIDVEHCQSLESLPADLDYLIHLSVLKISYCKGLKFLPDGLHSLIHLSVLRISYCENLKEFPMGGLPSANLKEFEISNCVKLTALPNNMHNLTILRELTISNCPGIISFPKKGFPINLTALVIRDLRICKELFGWGLDRLTSLRNFEITGGCPLMEFFPSEQDRMMLPTTIINLTINEFPSLKHLSSGFQSLTSLEGLWFRNCPMLRSPDKYPSSLLQFDIGENCRMLENPFKK